MTVDLLSPVRDLKHRAFLTRRDAELRRNAAQGRRDPDFLRHYAEVEAGMRIPELPTYRGPWAIAMVRNEADIVEKSIRHLVTQGVDHLLVVDNMSDDETPAILARLAVELPHLYVGQDPVAAYHQSEKMTFLADQVAAAGATWVIPFDADELWLAPGGRLVDALDAAADPVLHAHLYNLFPSATGASWRLDSARHFDNKVAFQPRPDLIIEMGNHEVIRPGRRDMDALRIFHLPWRSFEQFARKTRVGAAAVTLADLPTDKAYHWRRLGSASDEELREFWRRLLAGEQVADAAWYPRGELKEAGQMLPTSWSEVEELLRGSG